jgi:hypothetical protein
MKITAKSKKKRKRRIWLSLSISVVMLGVGIAGIDGIDALLISRRLLLPLIRLLAFITIGLATGQIIEALGWTAMLGRLGIPLFRFARLGQHCSAAFSAAFISGATANAMLYNFWKEGNISRYQLILTNLANQLPAFFLHLPTTMFIVLPLTGWAGGIYFILTFLAALLRFLLVLLWGNRKPALEIDPPAMDSMDGQPENGRMNIGTILKQKLPSRLLSVAIYVIPIYIAVFLLSNVGLFDWTRQWLAQWVAASFLPVEALSLVVLSFAAEYTSGFAAAGALMQEGMLSTKQAVLALLIGNVVAFPIRALRHQLPRLMGIFAPRLGMQLLLLGQGFRISSLAVVGTVFYLVG